MHRNAPKRIKTLRRECWYCTLVSFSLLSPYEYRGCSCSKMTNPTCLIGIRQVNQHSMQPKPILHAHAKARGDSLSGSDRRGVPDRHGTVHRRLLTFTLSANRESNTRRKKLFGFMKLSKNSTRSLVTPSSAEGQGADLYIIRTRVGPSPQKMRARGADLYSYEEKKRTETNHPLAWHRRKLIVAYRRWYDTKSLTPWGTRLFSALIVILAVVSGRKSFPQEASCVLLRNFVYTKNVVTIFYRAFTI